MHNTCRLAVCDHFNTFVTIPNFPLLKPVHRDNTFTMHFKLASAVLVVLGHVAFGNPSEKKMTVTSSSGPALGGKGTTDGTESSSGYATCGPRSCGSYNGQPALYVRFVFGRVFNEH